MRRRGRLNGLWARGWWCQWFRAHTALVAARQTLSLLEQGLLIAAERNSDDVSVMMNQPIVPPSE
jgi:hypothetical protein